MCEKMKDVLCGGGNLQTESGKLLSRTILLLGGEKKGGGRDSSSFGALLSRILLLAALKSCFQKL